MGKSLWIYQGPYSEIDQQDLKEVRAFVCTIYFTIFLYLILFCVVFSVLWTLTSIFIDLDLLRIFFYIFYFFSLFILIFRWQNVRSFSWWRWLFDQSITQKWKGKFNVSLILFLFSFLFLFVQGRIEEMAIKEDSLNKHNIMIMVTL